MRQLCAWMLGLLLLAGGAARAGQIGFEQIDIPNPAGTPIATGIWYPTAAPPQPHDIGPFRQVVANDAAMSGQRHALILLAHGAGGSLASHVDTALALAQAGFVVAAPTDVPANWSNLGRPDMPAGLLGRMHDLLVVADFMRHGWAQANRLGPRTGAFGYSAGAFSVLALAGAHPDLPQLRPHCAAVPDDPICGAFGQRLMAGPMPPREAWPVLPGLSAIVLAAPPMGFAFAGQVPALHIPVALWYGTNDTVLPPRFHGAMIAAAMGAHAQTHVVPLAGHFSFLPPCTPPLQQAAPHICVDAPGFDRAAFHRDFNAALVAFFRRSLGE